MINYFLRVVELKTKVVSIFSFFVTVCIIEMSGNSINIYLTILFFIAMLLFDMAVTGFNTIYGLKNEKVDTKDNVGLRQKMEMLNIRDIHNIIIVSCLVIISTVIGIFLVFQSSIWLLYFGVLSFGIGLLYSLGPIPICQTFLGELLSGIGEGILLPLCLLIINDINPFSSVGTNLIINIYELGIILLLLLPLTITISMLMLANNIEDCEEDVKNNRLTLVYYLGKENSILLFKIMYVTSLMFVVLNILFGLLSVCFIGMIFFYLLILRNFLIFKKSNSLKLLAVKNLVIINTGFIICSIITINVR